jgi:hypothetical protein
MKIQKFPQLYFIFLVICLIASACGKLQSAPYVPEQATATSAPFLNRKVQPDGQNVLVASLDLPVTLPANEPVTLKFTLQNHSDKALYFLKWYTPLEGISGKIFRVERDGQLIPYEGILAMRAAPTLESYIHLDPGESVSGEVDISNAYDFSQPGRYTVTYLSPNISHIAYSEAEMANTVDDLYPVNISSNEVSVEIVENSSFEPSFVIPAERALVMIEEYLREQQPDQIVDPDLEIEELAPESIRKSLQAQIFRVTKGESFLNELYLISEGQVLRLGNGVGGRGVTSMLLSDMDHDGVDELVFTFSSDSGTYQSRIGMYAPGYNKNQIFKPAIAYLGDLGLTIQEDGVVNVRIAEADDADLRLKYLATLGNLALREDDDGLVLTLKLEDNLPEEIKNKLVTGQITSDCQVWDRVQLDVENAGGTSPEEIAASLWMRYLEQFQSPRLMDRCKLASFIVDHVNIDPEEGRRISVGSDEYLALIDYAVQVAHKEETIWVAGSGREIESNDDGWIGKTVLVKVTKKGKVYILTIQGFG